MWVHFLSWAITQKVSFGIFNIPHLKHYIRLIVLRGQIYWLPLDNQTERQTKKQPDRKTDQQTEDSKRNFVFSKTDFVFFVNLIRCVDPKVLMVELKYASLGDGTGFRDVLRTAKKAFTVFDDSKKTFEVR